MAKNVNMEIFNLENKTAIVTGGYGYLGSGIVRALLKANANVVVGGRSKQKFEQEFTLQEQSRLTFIELDITDSLSIDSSINKVLERFSSIDILINNAHASKGNTPESLSDDDWAYTMDGVVGSVYKTIRAVIPHLKKQQSGKIINISSMYGSVSPDFEALYSGDDCEKYTNPPHYGAAKAAMNQLTRYFAVQLGKYNIQVNAIAPGPFPKPNIQEENPVFIDKLKRKNPLNKIGKPTDLDGVILLLSSSASDYITGQIIRVDGGWTIW